MKRPIPFCVAVLVLAGLVGVALRQTARACLPPPTPQPKKSQPPGSNGRQGETNQGTGKGNKAAPKKPGQERGVPEKPGGGGDTGPTSGDEFTDDIWKRGTTPKGEPPTSLRRKEIHLAIKSAQTRIKRAQASIPEFEKEKKDALRNLWSWQDKRKEAFDRKDRAGVLNASAKSRECAEEVKDAVEAIEGYRTTIKKLKAQIQYLNKLLLGK